MCVCVLKMEHGMERKQFVKVKGSEKDFDGFCW